MDHVGLPDRKHTTAHCKAHWDQLNRERNRQRGQMMGK